MRNRIVTAVKQRFSIRKLSIGAASVLLGTSLYFMGGSATIVHADTTGAPAVPEKEKTGTNDLVYVAKDSTKNDADVNNAIDKYAEYALEHDLKNKDNKAIIRPSDKQPVKVNTIDDRVNQVKNIQNDIQKKIDQANQGWDAINTCKKSNNHEIVDGKDSSYFENQSLSVDDEKDSEINQITVTDGSKTKNVNTKLVDGISKNIDGYGINITHTSKITDKEKYTMKVNSNNKVIVDFQTAQYQGKETTVTKEITVTYDDLNNSYYLQNKTNRIKISRIDRTFSSIQVADNPHLFNPNGQYTYKNDAIYDKCDGPQLIIYNDPSDGFFYNNIKQISVKDIYYDDKGHEITFNDKNPAWIFVTSLNSNGVRNDSHNVEKVRAQGLNNSPVNAEKIKGSTVTVTNHNDGWWYSDKNNWFGKNLDWDNNAEDNRFGFVGTVAFQYHPGMTLQYDADDNQWGSHWACMQTQVVSSLNEDVIIYGHIKDKTENVTRKDTVTRTIHYLYDNGNTAQPDKTQTVSFNETGTKDDVTGETTWSNDNAQSVDSVNTPSIVGYTPDKSSIEKQSFKFGDPDINVTVTYHANAQTAKIIYIDDTTKNNLKNKDTSGKFGQAITFATAPADEIANYKKQGYKLVSNDFNDNKYQADNNKNVFHVHFVHGTQKVSREHSASFTVHYIYKDGRQAKPDHEQALSFTENGIQDLVTQKITWAPADSQKFDDVTTPVITGYTPDQDKVIGQTANFETGNREVTVTYSPNVQIGHINYIDDNTGKTLTRDDFSGRTNEHEDYTSTDRIQEFENKGYELVSNNYPEGGFNFDNNDQQDQVFNVHFKHGIVTVTTKNPQTPNMPIDPDPHSPKYPNDISNTNKDVKRTIDYKFKDGKPAQPTVNDSLYFERTVVIDKVTGEVLSDTWTPSQDFNDIQTPAIQGYTPDKAVVSDKNIGHDHQDIVEHVVYSPDTQHMTITYIDDTTGETLHTDNPNGVSDQDANYTTTDIIKQYEEKHYKLVSDSTNGKDLIFDHDDNANQTYEVHFAHNTHAIDQTTSPKQTIHYVYADGSASQGKAIDDNVQQLSFKRDGYNDEVTGLDHWNAWTPANSQYKAVDSPVIQGYTPDKSVIEKSIVNPTDKDIEITVTYNANKQTARVIYVDKTTNTTLTSDDLSGKSDKDSEYNTKDKIGKYKSQHYVLAGDETNGKNVIFDHDDQQEQTYYVYFVHGTQKVNRQDTVTSTIDYKFEDGTTAQPTVTQTKQFSEDGIKDLVTGEITWTLVAPQKFDDIATNSIVGYTPDKDNVAGSTVKFGDKDIEVTVTYHNNTQNAVITYVDDTEKKTLGSDKQDGKFDHEIKFEHDPAEVIKGLEEKGYKLISDNFKPGIKCQSDNKLNTFEVHLVHTYEPVETSQTITETVHYIDVNGKSVVPDHVATVTVKKTGTRDKVTNSITWNTPGTGHFDEVMSPAVPNMTPDKKFIPGRDVRYGDSDITESVVYTLDEMPGESGKTNKPGDSTPKTPGKTNKPGDSTPKTPGKSNKPGDSTPKTLGKSNKPGDSTPKTLGKSNKPGKEVSKQRGTITETTIPEKHVDSRTADNQVSANSTAKRELPQTGGTINTGIWVGLASIIASLGLLGASKKRKKN